MICSWVKGVLFAFLRGSAIAIDCLFNCFRFDEEEDDDHNRSTTDASEEPVVSRNRNRLYSLLPSEACKEKERQYSLGTLQQPDIEVGELKDEATFLKCATLLESRGENLKVSEEVKDSTPRGGDSESSKFHSWLLNTSIKKLNSDNQPEQPPTPTKLSEEWVNMSGSLSRTPSSCLASIENSSSTPDSGDGSVSTVAPFCANRPKTSSASPGALVTTIQSKNKFVRFECDSGLSSFSSKCSSSESARQNTEQSEPAEGDHSVSKPSPYPTPLKLTDEMQTPGTAFPSYLEITGNGKNPRIRSQYVFSVMNPIETSQKVLKEEEEDSKCNQIRKSLERADESTPKSEVGMSDDSLEKGLNVESNLSSRLRPPPTNQNGNNKHLFRTPNSATKYKEDQKVKLQATPFEERLEKALSGETFIS